MEESRAMRTLKALPSSLSKPHSLRLRLMLWYGTLLVVALSFFAGLILFLTIDALHQSVESGIRTQARLASLTIERELLPTSPYWPAQLSLPTIDTYREPGVIVEVVDAHGSIHYPFPGGTNRSIPLSNQTTKAVLAEQTIWYTTTVEGEQVRVEVVPIRVPTTESSATAVDADGAPLGSGPVIGLLLIAKSLSDVNATLFFLQTVLLLAGLATLGGGLIGSWIIATRVLRPLAGI